MSAWRLRGSLSTKKPLPNAAWTLPRSCRSLCGMRTFIATMSYEVSADTPPEARKLLRAELVGRRWKDMVRDRRMPRHTVWIQRSADDEQTTSDLHDLCASELRAAARAVASSGRPIRVLRAFIQVAGGGTFGLTPEGFFDDPGLDSGGD